MKEAGFAFDVAFQIKWYRWRQYFAKSLENVFQKSILLHDLFPGQRYALGSREVFQDEPHAFQVPAIFFGYGYEGLEPVILGSRGFFVRGTAALKRLSFNHVLPPIKR